MAKGAVDVYIQDSGGERSPFWIEPRCRLSRMKQVLAECTGTKLSGLRVMRKGQFVKDLMPEDETKFLLEDHGLQRHDIIVMGGEKVQEGKLDGFVTVKLMFKGVHYQSANTSIGCTVEVMTNMVRQSRMFVPETVELWYKGSQLSHPKKSLIQDLGMTEGSEIEIRGECLPLRIISQDLDFVSNLGIHVDPTCIICLEHNVIKSGAKRFDCGHINVCQQCCVQYVKSNCPLCG